ncbi:MAG TPA: sulfite exporter TauE/SafE family protein [Steroidobacteraceae bacterium]|nr:sulfite exporter TauE/SafE family protein [Steroidobacteraceae bacterium]
MMIAEPLQWMCALLGALMVGISKAGITGLSLLSVALFTHVFPSSKQASGLVLPLLIFGDFVAVLSYREHTQWRYLWRLMPWTAAGVVLGYFALGHVSDRTVRIMIGVIIVSLCVLGYWRRYVTPQTPATAGSWHWTLAAAVGITAGFITLVANAAGPLMAIYLVAMRLPKMQFVGTVAVFFMVLNLFKVPFMVELGLITVQSFAFNLALAPAVLLGAFAGRWLLMRINQRLFEKLVLALSAIAGVLLIV